MSYDAFGRKKDEAGLGDLGWGTTGGTPARPQPTAQSAPPREFQTVTPVPPTGLSKPRRNPLSSSSSSRSSPASRRDLLRRLRGQGGRRHGPRDARRVQDADHPERRRWRDRVDDGDDKVPEQVKAAQLLPARRAARRAQDPAQGAARADHQLLDAQGPHQRPGLPRRQEAHRHFSADAEVPEEFVTSTASRCTDTFLRGDQPERAPAADEGRQRAAEPVARTRSTTSSPEVRRRAAVGHLLQGRQPIAQGDSRGRYTRRIS